MKNLKKVLALGLALIMLMGMFSVVSAAETKMVASDLTDWNDVQHKDAVSLMVDLGIINGIPGDNGSVSYQPTANITRAEWAKMVYYAATGTDDADAYLGTGSGLGDIAGNWAEAYINYLYANQLISGDNMGNYNPSNNVTVAEACKMMLTTLGYDATDRGYQGTTAWAGNVIKDANRNGLLANVDRSMTALVPLTRDNAAEIVLNALNANMVTIENGRDNGEHYVVKYEYAQTLGYDVFDLVKVTATISKVNEDGYAEFDNSGITAPIDPNSTNNTPWQVAPSITGKVKATSDMVGDAVNVYVRATNFKWSKDTGEISVLGNFQGVISSTAAKTDVAPVKSINTGITWKNLTTRGTSEYVANQWAANCKFYLNGEDYTPTAGLPKDDKGEVTSFEAVKDVTKAAARRGTVVDFFTNDDGEISTVKAYLYTFGKVTGGDATTKTLSDGTIQVRVPGVVSGWVDSDKITGWQGLKEDDIVLFYKTKLGTGNQDTAYTIEKAEKVSGKVSTFYSGGQIVVGGTKYEGSAQVGAGDSSISDIACTDPTVEGSDLAAVFGDWMDGHDLETEYDFYLDKSGAIGVATQLTEGIDASKVCLVIEADYDTNGMGTTGWVRANLLFADGSTEIVNISKIDRLNVAKESEAGKKIDYKSAYNKLVKDNAPLTKFYGYRTSSAGYELTTMVNDAKYENEVSKTYAKGNELEVLKQSDFTQGDLGLTADALTNFIVGKVNPNTDEVTYSVFKSFKNLPEMDATMVTAIAADETVGKTDTVARFVYLETGSFKDDVPEGLIFIADSNVQIDSSMADDEVYLVNIIDTDGSKTTMRVDSSLGRAIKAEKMTYNAGRTYVGNFWAVGQIDENGVVSALMDLNETVDQSVATLDVLGLGNDTITLDGEAWDYDASTVFVFVDWGWTDNAKDDANNPGKLDKDVDNALVTDYGTFRPAGFFNANEVDPDDTTKSFQSVQAVAIVPDKETTADYVYVLRVTH